MAGDPPDVMLTPRLAHIGMLEFDRADEVIAEGYGSLERMQAALEDALPQ
jgi:NTE family protein